MAITDKLSQASSSNSGRPVTASLSGSGHTSGGTSITINDATNWPTVSVIYFSIYTTTTVGSATVKDTTSQTDWKGTLSGTTISNMTIVGGADRDYVAGSIVELTPVARQWKDLYDWGTAEHKQTGAHSDVTADSISVAGNLDINDSSTAIRDSSDNELVKFSKTASSVNEITVTNAATGNPPQISATGDDTNISLKLVPKGSGSVIMPNPYKFRVYRNSAWTGSASYAKVQFDSEDFDSNSNFDSTTNYRYTAPVTGFYLFSARASNAQTGTSDTAIALYVNGSLHTTGALYAHTVNFDYSAEVTGLISLTASDYVEVYFKGGSTGRTGNKDTYFCGYLVSQT